MTHPSLLLALPSGVGTALPGALSGSPAPIGGDGSSDLSSALAVSLPSSAELLESIPAEGALPEEAQARLTELLQAFDPTGALANELDEVVTALREVAAASAESPHLDPLAPQLGWAPRGAIPDLAGAADSIPVHSPQRTPPPSELLTALEMGPTPGNLPELAQSANALIAPPTDDSLVSKPIDSTAPVERVLAPGDSDAEEVAADDLLPPDLLALLPLMPHLATAVPDIVARTRSLQAAPARQSMPAQAPAAHTAPAKSASTVQWSVRAASRPSMAPPVGSSSGNVSASPPPVTGGTFDSVPWLMADDAPEVVESTVASSRGASSESPPPPRTAPTAMLRDVSVQAARSDAAALSPDGETGAAPTADSSRSDFGAVRTVRSAGTLAPSTMSTAPEVPVMPHEKPLERVEARVTDGERSLRVGVARETDGYAVEVRAHRDFVTDIRELEADIDAALRDDGGEGLASFDASAEDEYSAADFEPSDSVEAASEDASTLADPRRILDRRV